MKPPCPAFGICGFSGSGKTTVIEVVVEELSRRGLQVGVIKHDVHGLNIDREGKDTDRFFKAGADVVIRGPEQSFVRLHRKRDMPLAELLVLIGPYYDLVLVEGHETTPLDQKVWMLGDDGGEPPPEATGVHRVLRRDEDRIRIVLEMIDAWLPGAWLAPPVYAGILIGGNSSHFAEPGDVRKTDGKTWLERTIDEVSPHVDRTVCLGDGTVPGTLRSVPVLQDVPDSEGPLAGMLAATRWMPCVSWVFVPCDVPLLSGDAVRWLLDQRAPGVWAVLPQLPDAPSPEPWLAYYDSRAAPLLRRARKPADVAAEDRVSTPVPPKRLQASWTNINALDD